MIIECVNCSKIFEVDSQLIPLKGRTIQCGSCKHVWFFNYNNVDQKPENKIKKDLNYNNNIASKPIKKNELKENIINKKINKQNNSLIKYTKKPSSTFTSFLKIILVSIISFISLIIILDTFKIPLGNIYPNLELILYNLYETIKDLLLFFKDLS